MPERPGSRQREAVKRRAQDVCEYCRSQEAYSPDSFSVEHIIPLSKGGKNDLNNLSNSCQGRNNRKYVSTEATDPLTGEIVPLYHPRKNTWDDHFAWNEDFTLMIGLTAIGRATVNKLGLNRTGMVNLRRLLQARGLHP